MYKKIVTPIAPVRRETADTSELVSQFLFGEIVIQIETFRQWCFVKSMNDGYAGWVDGKQLGDIDNPEPSPFILANPVLRIPLLSGDTYLPAGARLEDNHNNQCRDYGSLSFNAEKWMRDALSFLGAPYLWGGKTILGMDCSGLVQIAADLNGLKLPRDAYQQAEMGSEISFLETAAPGDLAFFGEAEGKITHVGIVLSDKAGGQKLADDGNSRKVIHASGEVRIDLIDHNGIYNLDQGKYTHDLRVIKRLHGNEKFTFE